MKIAAAQISCAPGDLEANLRKVREFAARGQGSGADLVVFPEMTDTGYSMGAIRKHARPWNKGAVPELQKIATDLSLGVIAGISDRDGGSIFNAQVFVSREGEVLAKYRKTHLVTAAPLDERVCLSPGDKLVTCKIDNTDDGVTFCGSSVIVDAYGAILAGASADREELIYAEISEEVITDVRQRIPVFDHRRGDLYQTN